MFLIVIVKYLLWSLLSLVLRFDLLCVESSVWFISYTVYICTSSGLMFVLLTNYYIPLWICPSRRSL